VNPRLTDARLYDHRDFTHSSGLSLDYFRPTWTDHFLRWRGAIIVALLLALIGLAAVI